MKSRIKIFLIKLFNLINFLINVILIRIIHFSKRELNDKSLLIIRLDSIGDYVLVQNFFNLLRTDSPYKDFNITLCGNVIWKDLAEYCNKEVFDRFIWVDKKKFKWNIFYKYRLLKNIYQSGYESAVETTFSREILFGDAIIKASKAKERIGSTGSLEDYVKWKRKFLTDNYYTKLITQSDDSLFEFYRNKEFFEKLFHTKFHLTKPSLNFNDVKAELQTDRDFILIVPGSQVPEKRWSVENFSELIKEILANYHYEIILTGSASEKSITRKISDNANSHKVLDIAGRTSLIQFGKLISMAKLLISNDTSAIHFAAAVNTPFICISNGNQFGRFHPYPEEMNVKAIFIYPEEMSNFLSGINELKGKYGLGSDLNINTISKEKVIEAVKKFIDHK